MLEAGAASSMIFCVLFLLIFAGVEMSILLCLGQSCLFAGLFSLVSCVFSLWFIVFYLFFFFYFFSGVLGVFCLSVWIAWFGVS